MKAKTLVSAALAATLAFSLCSCGKSDEELAKEKEQREAETSQTLLELGVGDLPSGLSGACSGPHKNLGVVELSTMSQYLDVNIHDPYILPYSDVLYSIILTSPVSDQSTQVGIKIMSSGETLRFVNDLEGTKQMNYGPLSASDLSYGLLSTSIPDTAIQAGETMEWHAILNVDGEDIARCPASGESKLQ